MKIDQEKLADIAGLVRCETHDGDTMAAQAVEMTHSVYKHEQQYGQYCSIQEHIDCPPDLVYEYMSNVHCLSEWTYSVRDFKPTEKAGLYEGIDSLDANTKIFCEVFANPQARTVDYHCAWDQGHDLWMIYLNRIVPAELVLGKRGSVVFWSNCHHPYYDKNPYPELSKPDRTWVGEWWNFFYAGHTIELTNLKRILEHRYRAGLPIGPHMDPTGGKR
jgi:hypothetical protein